MFVVPLRNTNKSAGFTLVELSIVLLIIGLLISGIFKGMEIIEGARTKRLVSDLKAVESAYLLFVDAYKGIPGDLRNATLLIPGCTADNFCVNGNGNAYVASASRTADEYVWDSVVAGTPLGMESIQVWKHLTLQHFMGGVNISADPSSPKFGVTHPESPFGEGGFELYYDGFMTLIPKGSHILRIAESAALNGGPIKGALSPTQAARVDAIMDDGQPNAGILFANYGHISDTCKTGGPAIGDPSAYNTTGKPECVLYFKLIR